MKQLFVFTALISIFVFAACNKQDIEDDFVPVNEELVVLPTNDHSENQNDNYAVSASKAIFTINNENNEVFEKDDLLLTNNSIDAVSYQWNFGNGDTSTEAQPTYKYNIHGYYTVKLTIIDADGNKHHASSDILVHCIFGGGEHDQ